MYKVFISHPRWLAATTAYASMAAILNTPERDAMPINLPLLKQFVRQDLIDRHASTSLGVLWTFLLPLSQILIFTLIFSSIMGMRLEALGMEQLGRFSYSVYLVVGLLAWLAFAAIVNRCGGVYQEKAALITKVQLPLNTLPLYVPVTETVIYLIGMGFFAIFLLMIGFEWSLAWLWWPVIYAVMLLMAYAIGLCVAVLSVFLRDIREVVGIVLQIGFWLTPIVYVKDMVPDQWHWMYQVNPIYHLVDALRVSLIMGQTPALLPLVLISVGSIVLLMLGMLAGRKLERDIRDFV